MASIATDLHARLEELERQFHGRQFAHDLHDRLEGLERRLSDWRFAERRQPPPITDVPAGLAVAALVGGLAGACLALLFARQAGRETRAQLHEASAELAARANALAGELRAEGQALREQARDTLYAARAEVAARRAPGPEATGAPLGRAAATGTDERVSGTA